MKLSAQIEFEYFQEDNETKEQAMLLSNKQSLLTDLKEKMPDKLIKSYICDNTGQQDPNNFLEFTITHNLPLTERERAPVYFIESRPLGERAISLQKWLGIVIKKDKDTFTAKLINLTKTGYDEEAEFEYSQITEEDIQLIEPGALFYWSIGYNHSSTGQRRVFFDIRFKRVPTLTKKDIEIAKSDADQTKKTLGW